MENIKKRNLFNFIFLGLIFIGTILTTCGITFAIYNWFTAQSEHKVKISHDFVKLNVKSSNFQDNSVDKYLVPIKYPTNILKPYQTHKVIHKFDLTLENEKLSKLPACFLKTTIKYENDEIGKFFASQLLVDDTLYNDEKRYRMDLIDSHTIAVETQQKDFIDENIKEITIIVEYELIDLQGKPFEGTKEIIKSQIVNNNTISNN